MKRWKRVKSASERLFIASPAETAAGAGSSCLRPLSVAREVGLVDLLRRLDTGGGRARGPRLAQHGRRRRLARRGRPRGNGGRAAQRRLGELEEGHGLLQLFGLAAHLLGRGREFLGARRVLLRRLA